MYHMFNNNYPNECSILKENSKDVRSHLKFLFNTAFTIVDDSDSRLEDDFLFCSISRYESIEQKSFEELKEEFKHEFDWTLEKLQ